MYSTYGERLSGLARRARPMAPLMLIPLGMAYCLLYELTLGRRETILASLGWGIATLSPWVIAAIAFESLLATGETRGRVLLRAFVLALVAYLLSALAAQILGADTERAFYSRLPLIAAAVAIAYFYPIPRPIKEAMHGAAHENGPPVAPGDIFFASAAGNYIELHAGGRTFIWRQTMHKAEQMLRESGFVRVHRSYLVPWHSIETVLQGRKGPVEVALRGGCRLPVSGRYAANLRA